MEIDYPAIPNAHSTLALDLETDFFSRLLKLLCERFLSLAHSSVMSIHLYSTWYVCICMDYGVEQYFYMNR